MNIEIKNNLEKDLKEMFETEAFKLKMSEFKAIEKEAEYSFKVVVTTEGIDRDGEIIRSDGIDFANYLKNPVVLVDHSYKIESIVGKTTKIYQENGNTIAEGVFAKGVEKAELIRALYNQGFVKTVSIGFIPKKRDNSGNVIEQSEMLEFSFVAVPANPEALSLDGKVYQKCVDLGLIKEEKTISTQVVLPNDLKVGDFITYRFIDKYKDQLGIETIDFYPSMDELPKMGRIIQKLEKGEEILAWDEIETGTLENPILTIQDYLKSENGPKIMLRNVVMTEYKYIKVEKIISIDEIKKGFNEFCNSEFDIKQLLNNINFVKEEVSEMKSSLKTIADDKVSVENLEKSRKLGQDLAKSLSAYLQEAKKVK